MTRLPESSSWEDEIELISRSERVSGGLDGVANRPLKALANRTRFLKEQADKSSELVAEKISAVKTFSEGATLKSPREEILYGEYRLVWTGAFPKVVPANSTPAITGGVGAGRWAYTSDAMIRQILTSIDGIVFIGSPEHTGQLKAVNPAEGARLLCRGAYSENDGGASWWKFVSGNHSKMVTNYPHLCRAPLADPTGASGVWANALDGDLLTHRFGMGISQDPVVNGEILRNLLAWNSDIEASIADGYGKKIVLCGDVIWIDYVEITQSSVHIQGAKGATANQYGGKGTVLMFRDGDSTKPAFTVSGKYTADESTGRDKVEGRVTGVKLDNLTLVAEQFFKNATPAGKKEPAPTTFTPRSSRLGLVIQYTGGHGGIDGVTSIGFAGSDA